MCIKEMFADLNAAMSAVAEARATNGKAGGKIALASAEVRAGHFVATHGAELQAVLQAAVEATPVRKEGVVHVLH